MGLQTRLYRQQHGEILRCLDDIARTMQDGTEEALRKELSTLTDTVAKHLELEDSSMYPAMLKNDDPFVRNTAEYYQRTMGDLAPVYLAFHGKWSVSGALGANRDEFIQEFNGINDALKNRIVLENKNLYDLIDDKDVVVV